MRVIRREQQRGEMFPAGNKHIKRTYQECRLVLNTRPLGQITSEGLVFSLYCGFF